MNIEQTIEDLAMKHGLDTRDENEMRKLHIPPQSKRIKRATQAAASEDATPAKKQKL